MDPFQLGDAKEAYCKEKVYFPADSGMRYPVVSERGQSPAQDGLYQGQDGTCCSETTWIWKMLQKQSRRRNGEHSLAHKNTCNFPELPSGIS